MKKTFNKVSIMKSAWRFFRAAMGTFAECLRMAWNNAKVILNAQKSVGEETHTWYAWKMLGMEVIHESVALFKVTVFDEKTKNHTRVLSYFGKSQVAPVEA